MKAIWTSESLKAALGVEVPNGLSCNITHFNSRNLEEGDLFIAIQGNGDGHDYVLDAFKNGAACAIVSKEIDGAPKDKLIIVEDTYKALYALAEFKRRTSRATLVAVTGSVGKTSTKEVLYGIFKSFGKSFASRTNFNNHLGLPLNLASMEDDVQYAIFELGMDALGEISTLSKFLKPHISVITQIAPVHLAQLKSLDNIAAAKSEIFDGMDDDGIVVLNIDDKYFDYLSLRADGRKILSFGESLNAMSRLVNYTFNGTKANIELHLAKVSYKFDTSLAGHHMARNLACGLITAESLGLNALDVIKSMQNLRPVRGRGEQIKLKINGNECLLVHDCYNASPTSVIASLKHLGDMNHSHKIVVLADMRDLGENEKQYHKDLTQYVINSGAKKLYTVGPLMKELHDALNDASLERKHFANSLELQNEIIKLITANSMILIKGSRSMGLLDVADFLIKEGC